MSYSRKDGNPWALDHERWYARATPAERAAFDASRSCPRQEVFTPAKFPTLAAWSLFLSHQNYDEQVAGTPLPACHVVKGQTRVYEARQDREQAIAGIGKCQGGICHHVGADVQRYRCVAAEPENGGQDSEGYLCADCVKWRRIDPMYGCASVDLAPLEG